jgi:DNA-binding LacI/PurR family transcriptional regulator
VSSVRAIAKSLDLSAATVSRVLNNRPDVDEETRRRVLDMVNQVGYFPKVGARQTDVVGLAYPDEPVQTEYGSFEPALQSGIMRGLDERQFDLKFVSIRRDKDPQETYTQLFMRKGLRGVILRCFRNDHAMIQKIAREQFPMIVVAEHFDDPNVSFVRSDSYESSRRAMEHLLLLGHRRIALAIHNVADSDHADRRRAYADALHVAGVSVQPGLIFENPASFSAGERVVDGILAMRERPTAVYATNPMTALGIMRRGQQLGLVIPRDLSLVGMDDSDVRSHVWPRMSAVCQDASALGYEAASALMQVLTGGKRHAVRKMLPTTFEVNGTTAPPGSGNAGADGDGSVETVRKPRGEAKAKRTRK